jgi:translocation protein SEC72
MEETFLQQPISLDPTTKAITPIESRPSKALAAELIALNSLHRELITAGTGVPPPPLPVNPKRSAVVQRFRESGNQSFKKGDFGAAISNYSFGIKAALDRPGWEPAGLVREELAALYANRSQAHMAMQAWPEGSVDAETSAEMKSVGNSKAWWRRGQCLKEMGRWEEAREWVGRGREFEVSSLCIHH